MKSGVSALAALFSLASFVVACDRDSHAAADRPKPAAAASPPPNCGHASCGTNFFIDVAPGDACLVGAPCTSTINLVATGAYHINDDYPYKFKAEEAPGIEFLGTDGAGKNVFSKVASDWRKKDEKTGAMAVKWQALGKGEKTITGVFKFSVCSVQACQLEQAPLSLAVAAR